MSILRLAVLSTTPTPDSLFDVGGVAAAIVVASGLDREQISMDAPSASLLFDDAEGLEGAHDMAEAGAAAEGADQSGFVRASIALELSAGDDAQVPVVYTAGV